MGRVKPGKPRRPRPPQSAYVVDVGPDDTAVAQLLAEALARGRCAECGGPASVSIDGANIAIDHVEGCTALAEVRAAGTAPIRHA